MRHKLILIPALAMASLLWWPMQAQKKSNVLDISKSITDNAIVYPESFETDTQALLEGWYMKNYTATDDRYKTESGPAYTDAILMERLKNMPTVIDMPYNQIVRSYIDRYAKNGRKLVTACLGLGNYYMPIIEQALEAEGIPNELKYLPMIESAYNPNAVSRAGATGMWQFMLAAAKGYDMEVNSLIDERRDPYESSKKGAKMLHDLYNTYGRWDLAIAAYNCGPGNVNKAIRRAGGDPSQHDFWSIYNYLPSETRGYFPMFIAANYIMNYYQDHGISPVVPTKPLITDTVGVSQRVNLNQISNVLNMPLDELRILNPQFRADIIPGSEKKSYMLTLPAQQIHAYILSENDILAYDAKYYAQRTTADPGTTAVPETEFFTEADNAVAEEAENEAELEEEYRALRAQGSKPKSEQNVSAGGNEVAATSGAATARRRKSGNNSQSQPATANFNPNANTHKVAAGETLESIAQMYGVSPDNIKIWNGLKRNSVRTGQKLTVKAPSRSQSVAQTTPVQTAPAKSRTQVDTQAAKAQSRQAKKAQQIAAAQQKAAAEAKAAKQAKKNKKSKAAVAAKPATHEVKSGESLERIARKNGVTVDELRKANKSVKGDMIRPGDKLTIPSKKGASAKGGKKGKGAAAAAPTKGKKGKKGKRK